ncbi:MAG TPA: hypothetical protein VMG11_09320 [Steroidobacteraceae bacterium]|nr:hypothetical protein [Steroidobacteraceae bacterium]
MSEALEIVRTYSYAHVPTVRRFSQSRAFIRGLMGPFGSGKSSGCVIELVKWGKRQQLINGKRRARFAVIRNTYPQLADTTIKTFLHWLPDGVFGRYNKADHTYALNNLDDLEVEILFRALDRQEHVANLLSLELTGAWCNEAREIPWAVIRALKGRVDRYPAREDGGAVDPGIIMDSNPPDDDSWWYRMFEEQAAEDDEPVSAEIFKQPGGRSAEAENLPNLSARYYQNLMAGADDDFIRVYVDGQYGYVKDGKPVFPGYNDNMHCTDVEPMKGVTIKRGWDFGLTPACVFTQVLPDGRWIVFEELCGDDIGIGSFADCVLELTAQRFPGYTFEDYGDPAGEQRSAMTADRAEKSCYDILRGKGIMIRGGEQNLTIRLESVRKPLNTLRDGKPQFQISPRCETLRKGFLGPLPVPAREGIRLRRALSRRTGKERIFTPSRRPAVRCDACLWRCRPRSRGTAQALESTDQVPGDPDTEVYALRPSDVRARTIAPDDAVRNLKYPVDPNADPPITYEEASVAISANCARHPGSLIGQLHDRQGMVYLCLHPSCRMYRRYTKPTWRPGSTIHYPPRRYA